MDKEKEILKLDMDCINCGQPAVAGSNLCADCLVKERDILEKEVLLWKGIIRAQRMRDLRLQELFKEALDYGFKKNQENMVLHRKMAKLYQRINRRLKSGKKRVQEDK